ncbi:MFS transporter [Francisella sp. 19S2-4]|nr:MFS transporter [Francisella sp. 19S2-4]MED7820389.1 MFS transporter [Francisella sp. 19S2-4]
MLMEMIDIMVLSTSLPQIAYDFKINPIQLKVAISIYLLTLGMFIPCASWVSDKYGTLKVLSLATVGFILASTACGLSHNETELVIFRAFQGACGAFTVPVSRIIMVRMYPKNIISAMSFISTIVVMGPLLGPLIGGAITTWLNWRIIFFVNIPVGMFALWSLLHYFPKILPISVPKFDLFGFVMISSSLALLLFVMDTLTDQSIDLTTKIVSFILGILFLFCYILHVRKCSNPVINLRLFKNPSFRFFAIMNTITRLFLMGYSFLYPLYLQTKLGFSPFNSGLSILPMLVGVWVAKRFVKSLLSKLSFQKFILIMLLLILVTNLLLVVIFLYFNLYIFMITIFLMGWALSGLNISLDTGVYKSLKPEDIAAGTTINSAIIQLGSSFAIAIIASVLMTSSLNFQLQWDTIIPNYSYSTYVFISAVATIWMIYILIKTRNINLVDHA